MCSERVDSCRSGPLDDSWRIQLDRFGDLTCECPLAFLTVLSSLFISGVFRWSLVYESRTHKVLPQGDHKFMCQQIVSCMQDELPPEEIQVRIVPLYDVLFTCAMRSWSNICCNSDYCTFMVVHYVFTSFLTSSGKVYQPLQSLRSLSRIDIQFLWNMLSITLYSLRLLATMLMVISPKKPFNLPHALKFRTCCFFSLYICRFRNFVCPEFVRFSHLWSLCDFVYNSYSRMTQLGRTGTLGCGS